MSQTQSNRDRFAGRWMIQDSNHMSHIPQVQEDNTQGARQSDQSQAGNRQAGGGKRQNKFEYQNPRQVY